MVALLDTFIPIAGRPTTPFCAARIHSKRTDYAAATNSTAST